MTRRLALPAWAVTLALILGGCAGEESSGEPADESASERSEQSESASTAEAEGDPAEQEARGNDELELTFYLPLPVMTIAMFPAIVAEHQGYFAEEGLAVEVVAAGSSSLALQQMAAGSGQAGLIIAGSLVNAIAQGQDFVAVHDFILRPTFDILVPPDSEIETYADLQGARIGIGRLEGGELPEIRGDLASVGLTEGTDYTLVVLGEDQGIAWQHVMDGRADAHVLSYNHQVTLQVAGMPHRLLPPPYDLSEARPGAPLVVTRDLYEEHPWAVDGMGRALNKAILFALENPDAALAIMREAFPEEHGSEQYARTYMERALAFSDPELAPEGPSRLGAMALDGWKELAEMVLEDEDEFDVERHVTNEHIDAMNDFDGDAIRSSASDSGLTYP